MVALKSERISLMVSDVSGQKRARITDLSPDRTIGELVEGVLPQLHMPASDSNGRPLVYRPRLEREGRYLHNSELVGESLQEKDSVRLQPNIDAGAPAA